METSKQKTKIVLSILVEDNLLAWLIEPSSSLSTPCSFTFIHHFHTHAHLEDPNTPRTHKKSHTTIRRPTTSPTHTTPLLLQQAQQKSSSGGDEGCEEGRGGGAGVTYIPYRIPPLQKKKKKSHVQISLGTHANPTSSYTYYWWYTINGRCTSTKVKRHWFLRRRAHIWLATNTILHK